MEPIFLQRTVLCLCKAKGFSIYHISTKFKPFKKKLSVKKKASSYRFVPLYVTVGLVPGSLKSRLTVNICLTTQQARIETYGFM